VTHGPGRIATPAAGAVGPDAARAGKTGELPRANAIRVGGRASAPEGQGNGDQPAFARDAALDFVPGDVSEGGGDEVEAGRLWRADGSDDAAASTDGPPEGSGLRP